MWKIVYAKDFSFNIIITKDWEKNLNVLNQWILIHYGTVMQWIIYSVIKQFKEALCTNRKNAQDALDQGWPTFS